MAVMAESLADSVMRKIDQAAGLYHRLVMLVAPAGSGKTAVLQNVHDRTAAPLVNVNLELSRRMLDLTSNQRAMKLSRLLAEIVGESAGDVVLLDNIELLFDVSLKQDPLRLLQELSRNRTVVAAWNGEIKTEGQGLSPEHTFLVLSPCPSALSSGPDLSNQSSLLYMVYATPDHPEYKRYLVKDYLVVAPFLPCGTPANKWE